MQGIFVRNQDGQLRYITVEDCSVYTDADFEVVNGATPLLKKQTAFLELDIQPIFVYRPVDDENALVDFTRYSIVISYDPDTDTLCRYRVQGTRHHGESVCLTTAKRIDEYERGGRIVTYSGKVECSIMVVRCPQPPRNAVDMDIIRVLEWMGYRQRTRMFEKMSYRIRKGTIELRNGRFGYDLRLRSVETGSSIPLDRMISNLCRTIQGEGRDWRAHIGQRAPVIIETLEEVFHIDVFEHFASIPVLVFLNPKTCTLKIYVYGIFYSDESYGTTPIRVIGNTMTELNRIWLANFPIPPIKD